MQRILTDGLSLVVPVYGNEGSIEDLIRAIEGIRASVEGPFEAIFVIDGSPDRSHERLTSGLPKASFRSRIISLTRNFGAFSAIRVGLEAAQGARIAVMAADLQEPPSLVLEFDRLLRVGNCDVVFGRRESREDPWSTVVVSGVFWWCYRQLVIRDVPSGGVDVFALTHVFRDRLLALREANSSLLAQLFWIGGRRGIVPYSRERRRYGKSAWTLRKKMRYFADSVFAFTDLPIRLLMALGVISLLMACALGSITLFARMTGLVEVPGYTGTMLVILFFGALNALGLGVVGTYAWRTFENTKARPLALIHSEEAFGEER